MKKFCCTNCSYLYRPAFGEEEVGIDPGTDFESVRETFVCPSCGSGGDEFVAAREEVMELFDDEDPSEAEIVHIPFYRFTEEGVAVTVGTEDLPHPDEGGHFIEWVGLFDEDGDCIETKIRPESWAETVFEGCFEEDFAEIRSSCTLHGIWKGLPKRPSDPDTD